MSKQNVYQCQMIGAGAAGLSFIIALANQIAQANAEIKPYVEALLESLVVIDGADASGGAIGSYQINANTDAVDVVSGIQDGSVFAPLRDQFLGGLEAEQVMIPLPEVGERVIQPLVKQVAELLGDRLVQNSRVARIVGHGGEFESYDQSGQLLARSKSVVLCCGGREVLLPDLEVWKNKVQFSAEFLRVTSLDGLIEQPGSIVIVGSSHSGFSCAWRLLSDPLFSEYAKGREIYMFQRSELVKLRCTPEFAHQHSLAYNDEQDICLITGLVYRHAGLRKDAKALYLKIKNEEERRVRLVSIEKLTDQKELLNEAGLILQCTGFHAAFPEIEIDGTVRCIDEHSKEGELRDSNTGQIIPGLFGNGLGMQIIPEGDYQGEKSFTGSVDGMQAYPLVVAPQIIQKVLQR